MRTIETLTTVNTELNADSVEWCPIQGFYNILACATYELESSATGEDLTKQCGSSSQAGANAPKQSRQGSLNVYELQDTGALKELSKVPTSGILDCKWSDHRVEGNVCIAAANATGCILLFALDEERKTLRELSRLDLSNGNRVLVLSLDWSNKLRPSDCRMVASDSLGNLHLITLDRSELVLSATVKSHDFEAWIAAFDYFNPNVYYSGGDDSLLKIHDSRFNSEKTVTTIKEHSAGVTSIQSNWKKEFSLLTGSYDERVLCWDSRTMKRPVSDTSLPGGVWRIKHDPFNCELVACSCMYGGSAVIEGSGIIATYDVHKSINYGIDWCWKKWGDIDNYLLSVCSFYDNFLTLATLNYEPTR